MPRAPPEGECKAARKRDVKGKKKEEARIEAVVLGMARTPVLRLGLPVEVGVADFRRDVKEESFRASGPVAASAASAARGTRKVCDRDWEMESRALRPD